MRHNRLINKNYLKHAKSLNIFIPKAVTFGASKSSEDSSKGIAEAPAAGPCDI